MFLSARDGYVSLKCMEFARRHGFARAKGFAKKSVLLKGTASAVPQVLYLQRGFSP
jgi:hypothetical protein